MENTKNYLKLVVEAMELFICVKMKRKKGKYVKFESLDQIISCILFIFFNRVAIKFILERVEGVADEISLMSKLKNPYIIQYLDHFYVGPLTIGIVMTYCEVWKKMFFNFINPFSN